MPWKAYFASCSFFWGDRMEEKEFWRWIKLKVQIVQLLTEEGQSGFEIEVAKRLKDLSEITHGHNKGSSAQSGS